MRYQWNDWTLDRDGGQLKRQGRPVETSRKVLDCIRHLIVHRERIVAYDELIRILWGHDDASNHQLSQVVLAARRLLGDDGQAQRCIRTATGQGYHWVAPVIETAAAGQAVALDSVGGGGGGSEAASLAGAAAQTPDPQASARRGPAPQAVAEQGAAPRPALPGTLPSPLPRAAARPPGRRPGIVSTLLTLCAVAAVVLVLAGLHLDTLPRPIPKPGEGEADTLSALRKTMASGRYDEVREALSSLPVELAESPEAVLLAIDLDIQRGRFDRARDRIDAQLSALEPPRDPAWKAQLLIRESTLASRRQAPGAEVFAPADAAVTLLLSSGGRAPQALLADALRVRANGYNLTDRPDAALRDLAQALDIHERDGDAHRIATVRASRARTWMRMGRMPDALDELSQAAEVFRRHDDKVGEVLARNTMAKIQIESLQWQDALLSSERAIRLLRDMQDSDRRHPAMQLRAMALIGVGRLREASSLLEEAEAVGGQRSNGVVPAIHLLESGRPRSALGVAADDFRDTRIDTRTNLLLENREGALLLWTMAAQALTDRGETPPSPSVAQLAMLEAPANAVSRIARGRWLSLQGEDDEAERELRHSLQEAQASNQRFRMLLAAEPLVDLALRRGDSAEAQRVVENLYGYDPDTMGGDYRFSLLRLRIALADDKPAAYEQAHRKALELAGERRLPGHLESLYAERRHRDGGPLWSGPVSTAER